MDIRKSEIVKTEATLSTDKKENKVQFKAGTVTNASASLMLPLPVQGKLKTLTEAYGIPFDLSNIGLSGDMPSQIKALRTITEMVEGNSKLLPEMLKLIKRLMRAEIKLAQFHRGVTTAALKHQEKLDKYTADIFLKMAGYASKAMKLEHRTNVRKDIIEKRTQAYSNYYQNTVYGEESRLIDTEFELLESNKQIQTTSKIDRKNFDNERKQKIEEYVQSAFTD